MNPHSEGAENTSPEGRKGAENTSLGVFERVKGRVCSAIIPGTFLLGTKLGDWYEKNPYHRFDEGDILILSGNAIGFGIRPVAVVKGYDMRNGAGSYSMTMYRDTNGDSDGTARDPSDGENHFKWNIENLFKKVNVSSPEEALSLYKN